MKTIKRMLITVAVLLCSVVANAYDFEVDGIYYNIISASNLTVEVTRGDNKYSGEVIIPETIAYKSNVLKVTSIREYAFSGCTGLTSVTIPNSVTSIGNYAFYSCKNLKSITIPNSVTSIGNYAFEYCTSLKDLRIEDGEGILSLGYNSNNYDNAGLFYDCPLETLYLGRNLSYNTSRSYSPFYKKTTLTSVTIGSSVTTIGNYAFSDCDGLTSIEIPNSVESIGGQAFDNCTSLKDLRIEDGEGTLSLGYNSSNSGVGEGLFYDCPLETLYLGRNLSYNTSYSYGYSPFYKKTTLTSVTIGSSITSIGKFAFYYCDSLTSIEIPNSVTTIGNYAFSDCDGLTSVTIGNSVESIGIYAFRGCTGLTSIHLLGKTPPSIVSNTFAESQYATLTIYVPQGALDAYQAADVWKDLWDIREEGTTEIPEEEVKKCATPVITYSNSGLDITSETDGAEIHTYITCSDIDSFNGGRIDLSATYDITTYATKEGYLNSETATATLCWIAVSGSSEENSIIEVEAMPVLITCNNGTINISGGKDDAEVVVYTTSGVAVGNATITNGNASISTELAKGEIAVISIAGKGIKIVMQ